MENKKLSLSTFFLILAIIAIGVMAVFMYKFYNEKIESNEKTAELQSQVSSLTETVNDLEQKINNVPETINPTEKQEGESPKPETLAKDYSKYYGTWYNNNEDDFTVKNIGNDLITFTWGIFRTGIIEDVTVPLKDNKAVFYYQGYEDKNFNSKNEDDEFYCRKATVQLMENSISITVEDCTRAEVDVLLDKSTLFEGIGHYIIPGQHNFRTKQ